MSLNDPRWGRTGDDQTKPAQTGGETPKNEAENTQPAGSDAPRTGAPQAEAPRGDMPRAEEPRADNNSRPRQQQNGAADLDQLWDDFNRALGGLLGGRGQANRGRNPQEKNFDDRGLNDFRPDNGGAFPEGARRRGFRFGRHCRTCLRCGRRVGRKRLLHRP